MIKSRIIITGGTGYLGRKLAKKLYEKGHQVTIFSRSEARQADMKLLYPDYKYILGDVCAYESLVNAFKNQEIVIHCAALKRIDSVEDNIHLGIETNILGSQNVMKAADYCFNFYDGPMKAVLISTDKASRPHTAYGCTKYVAEQIFRHNNSGTKGIVIRYGNVIDSTGSVFEIWRKQIERGLPIEVRGKEMTRFYWGVDRAADYVINSIFEKSDKDIFIPEIEALNIFEMAKYLHPNHPIKLVDPTHNEKMHEELFPDHSSKDFVVSPIKHNDLNFWINNR